MAAPKKFTVTVYCGNCRTVGEYQFRRGTILHAVERTTSAEERDDVPSDFAAHEIHLNECHHGRSVECKFCGCATALYLRERNGDALSPAKVEQAPAEAPSTECVFTAGCLLGDHDAARTCVTETEVPY